MLYISISIQFPSIFHLFFFSASMFTQFHPLSSIIHPYFIHFFIHFHPFFMFRHRCSSIFALVMLSSIYNPIIFHFHPVASVSTLPWNAHCFTGCLSGFQMVILCFGPAQQDCNVFIIFINSYIFIYIYIYP